MNTVNSVIFRGFYFLPITDVVKSCPSRECVCCFSTESAARPTYAKNSVVQTQYAKRVTRRSVTKNS